MTHNGVTYDYAFEFQVQVPYKVANGSHYEDFRIVVSKYRSETLDFSGLCLENELTVISDRKIPFLAFVDIINETIDITISSIMDYANAHGGCIPSPQRKVIDEAFIIKFNEKKSTSENLYYKKQLDDYYTQLGEYLTKPENIMNEIFIEQYPDFDNYVKLTFFRLLLYAKISKKINSLKFFPI
jgi:hypothetical protein